MKKKTINKIEIRHLLLSDYESLKDAMISSYEDMENSYWKEKHIKSLITIFPEGQFVVLVDGLVVGCALSIILAN